MHSVVPMVTPQTLLQDWSKHAAAVISLFQKHSMNWHESYSASLHMQAIYACPGSCLLPDSNAFKWLMCAS